MLNLEPVHPETETEEDVQASVLMDAFRNRNYLDPLFRGSYPEGTLALLEPYIREGDLDLIKTPSDFLGLNLYTRALVRADATSPLGMSMIEPPPDAELTAIGWEVYPQALYDVLMDLKENYGNPIVYVTENGAAFPDEPDANGYVEDLARIRFFERYLLEAHRALEDGVNLKGYFVWTLLDNFEWAEGYHKRFGIVYIDYETLERRPKASYAWFGELIRENRLPETA